MGKVLIIDEAYGLNSRDTASDSFKTAVIDTLVAEVQAVPGDDRCVLLLGYEDKLTDMFQNVNPGLSRRFAIEDPFRFEDFDLTQLQSILELKLKDQDLYAPQKALTIAMEVLDRARMLPNFSNAGEVNNLLDKAKQNYLCRHAKLPPSERLYEGILEPVDFDSNLNRIHEDTCRTYLENKVANGIIDLLEGYQRMAIAAKALGHDPRESIPTRFVFKGPPG